MKLEECVDELFNGKKLRCKCWFSWNFIHMVDGKLVGFDGEKVNLKWYLEQGHYDWEVYDDTRMDIPDSFWEMVDPKWNYLTMNSTGRWYLYSTRPKKVDGYWILVDSTNAATGKTMLNYFDWYKDPTDWKNTLYKRPGV